jgi:hypothetical protein
MNLKNIFLALLFFLNFSSFFLKAETLPGLNNLTPPLDYDSMWKGFDPRAEPLDVEILQQWEQDDVVLQVLRYRVGIFKGQKSIMAGIYGYPKGQTDLPGLLQIHGGGQYAHSNAVLTNANRGYATLSIAWAGRISAPGYQVTPNEVKLFWEGKTEDPKYKLTTDWGALDAYHAPSRNGRDAFPSIPVAEWTLDSVKSPRNNSWFLITLAGRRGLTFLEQQAEVDGSKLGVYGHSMGGKLTVMIAGADHRVKAAAPSCGGISDRYSDDELHLATVSDPPSLKRISCPIIFLSPANDFHGRINDLGSAINEIKSNEWRVSCSPHHNHQDSPEFEVATQIWFDRHLKAQSKIPVTPVVQLELASGKLPRLSVNVDLNREVKGVEVFFTQQGIIEKRGGPKDNSSNTKHRFWQFVQPSKSGADNTWTANLPIFDTQRPLWVFANVVYALDETVSGAGYYYGTYQTDSFVLSSLLHTISANELSKSGTVASEYNGLEIDNFTGEWKRDWFRYNFNKWGFRTNKLHEPTWSARSRNARLSIEVKSEITNKMVLWIDGYGVELSLLGNNLWQRFSFSSTDFKNSEGGTLTGWSDIRELRLDDVETLEVPKGSKAKKVKIGSPWQGNPPEFRHLSWIE